MRHVLLIVALATALLACGKDNEDNPRSRLERPGSLPRPPTRGLPDDLRPPR